ncbi:hypothetical protein ACWCXB_24010 [Streptomyces sp. NPDC001514]
MTTRDEVRRARLVLVGVGVVAAVLVTAAVTGVSALMSGGDSPATAQSGARDIAGASAGGTASQRTSTVWPTMTPEKAEKVTLVAPTGQKDGVSTGFPRSALGALSAAVYFWEEFAFLDDHKARQQLTAVVSADSGQVVDARISEVRGLREAAGLPPSGGTPAGITFSTTVNAARPFALDDTGSTMQVWLNFDRYATKADGGNDRSPFRNEDVELVLKWESDAWRITDTAPYSDQRSFPTAYFPTSPYAWRDGWVQVRHGD